MCHHMCCLLQLTKMQYWCYPGGYLLPPARKMNIQTPSLPEWENTNTNTNRYCKSHDIYNASTSKY